MMQELIDYINKKNLKMIDFTEISDTEENLETRKYGTEIIKSFFSNPQNSNKINELKKALGAMKESMKEESIKKLLNEYRNEFRIPEQHEHSQKLWHKKDYQNKFNEIIYKKTRTAFNGSLPKHLKHLLMFRGMKNI
jgi:hypothetical protein